MIMLFQKKKKKIEREDLNTVQRLQASFIFKKLHLTKPKLDHNLKGTL